MNLSDIVQVAPPGINNDPTATFASPVTPGNTIIALHYFSANTSTPKNSTEAWVEQFQYTPATNRNLAGWTAVADASTPQSHTFGRVAGTGYQELFLFEVLGTIEFGQWAGNNGGSITSLDLPPTNPLTVTTDSLIFTLFRGGDYSGGYPGDYTAPAGYTQQANTDGAVLLARPSDSTSEGPITHSRVASMANAVGVIFAINPGVPPTPTLRKGSQFDVETTLAGTVTSATLDGAAITVDSQAGATVTLTDSDGSITTSGEYALVLTDDAAATETITVQVNVYGVAPSNNPLQKDGAALASLTNVEVRVSAGATLAGSQLFYSGTATTDASGNLGNIDLSSTAAADADPVLLSIRTAAGDSIVATETVGII